MFTNYWAAYNNTNELEQSEWGICSGFEASNVTIEMLDNDNETHGNTRCYPVDADSIKVYQ